mmetsp:Transcript_65921/g.117231  ORF Transcript_65921/g.117231 Transcript_65921/m.117231 type:complete len:401 (-) Transcript_65921:657-1859(-)
MQATSHRSARSQWLAVISACLICAVVFYPHLPIAAGTRGVAARRASPSVEHSTLGDTQHPTPSAADDPSHGQPDGSGQRYSPEGGMRNHLDSDPTPQHHPASISPREPVKPPSGVYKAIVLQGWYPSCNKTSIVRRLREVMANYLEVLAPYWQFVVLYTPMAAWLMEEDMGVPQERLTYMPTNREFTVDNWFITVNRMFKLKGFWRSLQADRVLIYQPDTVLCRNSPYPIEHFLKWDYIGAPWDGPWFQTLRNTSHDQLTADWTVWQQWGGNGGLSIRNPQTMIACLNRQPPRTFYDWRLNEDKFYSRCLSKFRMNIAPWHVGRLFSSETYINVQSLGYHKPLLKDKPQHLVPQILKRCPEFSRLWEYLEVNHMWQDDAVKDAKLWKTLGVSTATSQPAP